LPPNKIAKRVRRDDRSRTWKNAQVLRLVKAIRDLWASETKVAPYTYAQDPMLRLLVKDQVDVVLSMLMAEDRR